MRMQCQQFSTTLLDYARTSPELEVVLNFSPTEDHWNPGEKHSLERLKLAVKYKQKMVIILTK